MSVKTGENTMMVINMPYMGKEPSFSLIPISENAPFVECIFMPQEKQLAVISKVVKDTFHFLRTIIKEEYTSPSIRAIF